MPDPAATTANTIVPTDDAPRPVRRGAQTRPCRRPASDRPIDTSGYGLHPSLARACAENEGQGAGVQPRPAVPAAPAQFARRAARARQPVLAQRPAGAVETASTDALTRTGWGPPSGLATANPARWAQRALVRAVGAAGCPTLGGDRRLRSAPRVGAPAPPRCWWRAPVALRGIYERCRTTICRGRAARCLRGAGPVPR